MWWIATMALAAPCPETVEHAATPVVVVDKSDRWLGLYKDGRLAEGPDGPACFAIGLGFAPDGPKRQRGDGRTPEGTYFITHRNPQSSFYLSLGVSYPNRSDAAEALAAGTIDQATHDRIVTSRVPPQNTPMGGDIFIHGRGAGSDWTLGCIALDDADMGWLFAAVEPGTRLEIGP